MSGQSNSRKKNIKGRNNYQNRNNSERNGGNNSIQEVQIIQDPPSASFTPVKIPVPWALSADLDYPRSNGPPGWNYNPYQPQGQFPKIPWNKNYQDLPEWNQMFIPAPNNQRYSKNAGNGQPDFNNANTSYGFGTNNNNYSNPKQKKEKKKNPKNIWQDQYNEEEE